MPAVDLARPSGPELSPLFRGPMYFVDWDLDATHGPQLVGLSAHAFGSGVRGGGICRANPRLAARAIDRRAGGSLGPASAARGDANPRHAPGPGIGLATDRGRGLPAWGDRIRPPPAHPAGYDPAHLCQNGAHSGRCATDAEGPRRLSPCAPLGRGGRVWTCACYCNSRSRWVRQKRILLTMLLHDSHTWKR